MVIDVGANIGAFGAYIVSLHPGIGLRGLARDRRGDLAGAVWVWQAAAAVSKTCASPERQPWVQARLIRACEAALRITRRPNDAAVPMAHAPSLGAAS